MAPTSSFTALLSKIVKWTEIFGIILTVMGWGFKYLHQPGANEMLLIGLMTLAVTYFLSAYIAKVPEIKPRGLADNLVQVIRKVMFIGLSVYSVAFLFTILHLNGANEMMMIGLVSVGVSTAISMFLILGKRERMLILQAPLLRCVAALVLYYIIPLLG